MGTERKLRAIVYDDRPEPVAMFESDVTEQFNLGMFMECALELMPFDGRITLEYIREGVEQVGDRTTS